MLKLMFRQFLRKDENMSSPIISVLMIVLQIPAVIFVTSLHEFSRAAVSTALGDHKPKNEGRLTLNPAKHFEPIGFILMWATGFGWGKPVETSPMFYKNRKRDTIITAVMPSVINLVFAFIASILYGVVSSGTGVGSVIIAVFLLAVKRYSVSIAVYNVLPVAPMDCVKVLSCILPANTYFGYMQYEKIIQMVFLLVLFMGYIGDFINPIINLIMGII